MRRIALFCVLSLGALPALAKVEVEAVQHDSLGPVLAVRISEEIAIGDSESLLVGARANPGRFARKVALLDSIGGSVSEAMRLGRLLRELGFDTLVPTGGLCQGTCVYLLAAGHKKSVKGHVGLHRPYFPGGDSANSARASARQDSAAYFREMNIPRRLLDDMSRIEPNRMQVLTPTELKRYGLDD
ncbi:hypothetical protein [Pseudomonas sp. LRF_L74]|uniref:hypothetical protein n=1 Tax=Pseudomonas sp. LRF_L74 TaxID=3369422 RepID=UPI003F645E64